MPYIKNYTDTATTALYYEDHGSGRPVILIHGWPVSSQMWENQALYLAANGYRVISYDRRGFGRSDKPWSGYDYDTFASDLDSLIRELDLTDIALAGFSMGGGEVVRYISTYGSERISKGILVSSVVPGLLRSEYNPEGADQSLFDGMLDGIISDRQNFMQDFGKNFFGYSDQEQPVSEAVLDWHWSLCMQANLKATLDCVTAFSSTDFVNDLSAIDIPMLLIHGDADAIVPISFTSERAVTLLPQAELIVYPGAPHGLYISEKARLNSDILEFLNK